MWRLCKLGYRHEPGLILAAFVAVAAAALPDALLALWFKLLGEGVLAGRLAARAGSRPLALGVSATATWFLRTVSTRVQRRFRDKVTIALEAHVARLLASIATIAHQERPDYLDRLAVLRNQVFMLDHMYMSLFSTCGWILRLGVTIALLVSIHPALALLAVFALPTVLTSTWRPARRARRVGARRAGEPAGPPPVRRRDHRGARQGSARHRHRRSPGQRSAARPGSAGTGRSPRRAGRRRRGTRWRGRSSAAAYVGAIVFVSSGLDAPAGDVLLVLAAGSRLSFYIGATVGEIGFLRGIWMDGSRRLAWLEDYAASLRRTADQPAPARLAEGIRFEHVSFAYPGTERLVLDDVNLELPAGAVVAIVGENGAGKTTLVKLLAKMYEPTSAGSWSTAPTLARMPRRRVARRGWPARSRISSASSSAPVTPSASATCRAWTTSRGRHGGRPRGRRRRRRAADRRARHAAGPDLAGRRRGVSFGQWQKLALARGFMRDQPLLLVLDEPTAALDAETEHALFERYAAAARAAATARRRPHHILVSHRFSTVRMADLIVVLDGARVVEVGTHEELMAKRGQYAELYSIQAAAYSMKWRPTVAVI